MEYELIQETIEALERDETTFFNCQNLASLYIVREYLKAYPHGEEPQVEKELSDILPQYQQYKDIKRKYQMSEIAKEQVIKSINNVCSEIKEFFDILYRSTDMQEEREAITKIISLLYKEYGKIA